MQNVSDNSQESGEFCTPQQAGERLELSVATLAKMRCYGNGPPYFKVGKFVRYDSNDLDAWMRFRRRRYTSTSQESAA